LRMRQRVRRAVGGCRTGRGARSVLGWELEQCRSSMPTRVMECSFAVQPRCNGRGEPWRHEQHRHPGTPSPPLVGDHFDRPRHRHCLCNRSWGPHGCVAPWRRTTAGEHRRNDTDARPSQRSAREPLRAAASRSARRSAREPLRAAASRSARRSARQPLRAAVGRVSPPSWTDCDRRGSTCEAAVEV
jgi:hypothetical protein